jgi:hypothetical protein
MDAETEFDLHLTYRGLVQTERLRRLRIVLEHDRTELERRENFIRGLERELELTNSALKARKYHDIGHARCQFECPVVDGHHVKLTREQLDPTVAAYLDEAGGRASAGVSV